MREREKEKRRAPKDGCTHEKEGENWTSAKLPFDLVDDSLNT
jgi:hypothetical protein